VAFFHVIVAQENTFAEIAGTFPAQPGGLLVTVGLDTKQKVPGDQ
jgi:hypothetical protein